MERIKLNLIPSGVAPVVHLSQYDEGRKFGIDLFEGDSVYVLDGTETLTVNSRKPDGHVVVISVTNTGTSSLEVETVEQLTAVHGTSYAKLKIEKGSDVIATLEFLIAVSRDPLENGDPSESFVDNLNTQIAQAVSDQYDSNNVIFDNDPTTGHGTGFTVTSEGIKNAIDNAIGGLSIPEDLNDLNDVDTTTPSQGEALVWDGTKWVNGTVSTVGNLDDLSDVDTTGKQEGDSLRYIGNSWKAKPTTVEMTQAEYDAIVDFTEYANTNIVITDAPNLNPTASDIEYESGSSVADVLDSLADVATSGSFYDLLNKPTIDNAVSLSSTNAVQNKAITLANFFGNNGQYYSMSKTSLDAIANDVVAERYFSVDNLGDISGYGNRQFCFGWLNGTKKYGWIAVFSFGGMGIGKRNNADTFTVTKLV